MKYQQLKKRLVVESGVLAAVIIVLGGATYLLSDFSDDYQKKSEELGNKVNEISSTTSALRAKFDKVQQNEALYKEVLRLESQDGFDISQQIAKSAFNRFRDQYYLNNLHLSMSPVTPIKESNYQRPSNMIVSSEISIDFDGLSDEYVYDLLNAVDHELPGSSRTARIMLTRQGSINEEALRLISENGTYPLIKGEIKFIWFGINPVEPSDNSTNAPKNTH